MFFSDPEMFSSFHLFECTSPIQTRTTGKNYEEKSLFSTYWHRRFINLVSFYRKPSSGMWCRVVWQNFTDISSKYTVRNLGLKCSLLWNWNIGTVGFSNSVVNLYQNTRRHMPGKGVLHKHYRQNFKSPAGYILGFLRRIAHLVW